MVYAAFTPIVKVETADSGIRVLGICSDADISITILPAVHRQGFRLQIIHKHRPCGADSHVSKIVDRHRRKYGRVYYGSNSASERAVGKIEYIGRIEPSSYFLLVTVDNG